MNKKGFTLIELLATITILSIISIIAIPNVLSIIDRNQKDAYISDAKRLITLVKYNIRSNKINQLADPICLNNIVTDEFTEAPDGLIYDKNETCVIVTYVNDTYEYTVKLVASNNDNTKRKGMINYQSEASLYEDNSRNLIETLN